LLKLEQQLASADFASPCAARVQLDPSGLELST